MASVSGRRHLWSADRSDLLVPQFRTVNYGQRGFSTLGPRLWNSLPRDIRLSIDSLELFNNKLETYFFHCSSDTSASADHRHEWRYTKVLLHYITLQFSFYSYSYPHRLFHPMPCASSSLSYTCTTISGGSRGATRGHGPPKRWSNFFLHLVIQITDRFFE